MIEGLWQTIRQTNRRPTDRITNRQTKVHLFYESIEYKYRVFIKYRVFSSILKYILDSGLYRFPLGVSVCTQWQASSEKSQHFKEQPVHYLR